MLRGLRQGITLMELLVVLSVIATLSALLFPMVSQSLRRSYVTSCQSQLRQIGQALKMYMADYGEDEWPCHLRLLVPGYLSEDLLICPWERTVASGAIRRFLDEHPGIARPWSSYQLFCRAGLDAPRLGLPLTYSEVLRRRGEMTPVAICREHREPFRIGPDRFPGSAWYLPREPIVVLRKDGSVHLSMKGGTWTDSTYLNPIVDALEL